MSKQKPIIISVDSGKFGTKAVRRVGEDIKKLHFRTKMDETQESKTTDSKSFVIEHNGAKYLFGNSAETVDYEKSKAKLMHKLAAYAGICGLVDEEDFHVILAFGCPLAIFQNVEERQKYKDYFLSEKEVTIKINNKSRHFFIDDVVICPESSGIIFTKHKEFKNKLVGIIDIGGLNTNCCIYDNLSPVNSTMFTTNLGANILTNELKQLINSTFPSANISDWQMDSVIKNKCIKSNPELSSELIKSFFKKHMTIILNECKKKGWDLSNLDLTFIGGGSKLLQSEILDATRATISDSAEWDNALGYLVVGELNS